MYRRYSTEISRNLKEFWKKDLTVKNAENNEPFRVVWRIVNFSMCRLRNNEYVCSPIFVVETLQDTDWYLSLYPRGESNDGEIVCYLHRGSSGPDTITVKYKFYVGFPEEYTEKLQAFDKCSQSLVSAKADRSEILQDIQKYPAVDILLVECCIWNFLHESSPVEFVSCGKPLLNFNNVNFDYYYSTPMVFPSLDDIEIVRRKIQPYPESCSAYTHIPVERLCFVWHIKNFNGRQSYLKETISVASVSESSPKISVSFYVTEDESLRLDICEIIKEEASVFSLKCRIQIVENSGCKQDILQDIHLFVCGEVWDISLNICKSDILEEEDLFLVDDVLTLRCEFSMSYKNIESNIDSCNYVSPNAVSDSSEDVSTNTKSGIYNDMPLKEHLENGFVKNEGSHKFLNHKSERKYHEYTNKKLKSSSNESKISKLKNNLISASKKSENYRCLSSNLIPENDNCIATNLKSKWWVNPFEHHIIMLCFVSVFSIVLAFTFDFI